MKKLLVVMMAAFIPVFLLAQNTPLSAVYDKYAGKPGFVAAEVFPGSTRFIWDKALNDSTIKDILKNIESIRILIYKAETEKSEQERLWKKIKKSAGDEQYKELVTIYGENIRVNIYMMKDPGGKTREVALLAELEKGIALVTIDGNIDFSSMFSTENMQKLREMVEYYMKNKGECKLPKN